MSGYDGTPLRDFAKLPFDGDILHWCGIRLADGVAICAGDNTSGEAPPERRPASGEFIQIAVGFGHTCALRDDLQIECWGVMSNGAHERVPPEATFHAPASVIVGQPIELALSNAHVPGVPSATSFRFAFDCGEGFGSPAGATTATCPTSSPGTRNVGGRVIDLHLDASTYTAVVAVLTVEEGTADLVSQVDEAALSPDLRQPLRVKLDAALEALDAGRTATACSRLQDFINQVSAQRGKAIPEATADAWIQTATQLRLTIGC